jgi:NTE family protein
MVAVSPRVTALIDHGTPPLLGYALACSVAWHTQKASLLIAFGHPPARELEVLRDRLQSVQPGRQRAYVRLIERQPGPETLAEALAAMPSDYGHVLLQLPADSSTPPDIPVLHLAGPSDPVAPGREYVIRSPLAGGLLRPDRNQELHVPAAQREDEGALVRGLLSPSTPMGRALGWAARHIAGLKVGVALGAGSALGYAHIGVLRALTAADVPIDYIAGASIGSCIAALHAAGFDHDVMAQVLDDVGASAWRLTLPRAGLLSVKTLRQHLRHLGGDRRIEDLPVPLAIVAADIESRREIVFRRGPVWPALLASIAIPGIFPPQRIGPYVLVDGGVVNPVPGDVVAAMGADVVITVKLLARPHVDRVEAEASEPRGPSPAVFQTLVRSIQIMQSRITAAAAQAATIQIAVDFAGEEDPGLRHFSEGRRFIARGESTVAAVLPALARELPWLPASAHDRT